MLGRARDKALVGAGNSSAFLYGCCTGIGFVGEALYTVSSLYVKEMSFRRLLLNDGLSFNIPSGGFSSLVHNSLEFRNLRGANNLRSLLPNPSL